MNKNDKVTCHNQHWLLYIITLNNFRQLLSSRLLSPLFIVLKEFTELFSLRIQETLLKNSIFILASKSRKLI